MLNKVIKNNFMLGLGVLFTFSLLDTTIGIVGPSGSALLVASLYYPKHFFILALVSYLGVFVGSTAMYVIARFVTKTKFNHKKHGKI